jgi:hypothetical protein
VRRVLLVLVVIVGAYAVGWASDAVLNDDPCVTAAGSETDSYEVVHHWLPVRADCRVTGPRGVVAVERGSADVFLAMFAVTLIGGLALLATISVVWRVLAVVAAALGCIPRDLHRLITARAAASRARPISRLLSTPPPAGGHQAGAVVRRIYEEMRGRGM